MTVYFVECPGSGLTKIGKARSLCSRLLSLQTGSPSALSLVAALPGYSAEEAREHTRFARARVRGEWFRLAPGDLPETPEDARHLLGPVADLPRKRQTTGAKPPEDDAFRELRRLTEENGNAHTASVIGGGVSAGLIAAWLHRGRVPPGYGRSVLLAWLEFDTREGCQGFSVSPEPPFAVEWLPTYSPPASAAPAATSAASPSSSK